jgi:hypothetical protein
MPLIGRSTTGRHLTVWTAQSGACHLDGKKRKNGLYRFAPRAVDWRTTSKIARNSLVPETINTRGIEPAEYDTRNKNLLV